jgi:hypothetical protein
MTAATTNRVPLADAARVEQKRWQHEQDEQRKENAAEYRHLAIAAAAEAARNVLGDAYADASWTPMGSADREGQWRGATATIDGLQILAAQTYSYGWSDRVYLLKPCPSSLHPPADAQAQIGSLYDLATVLDEPGDGPRFRCFACAELHRAEQLEAPSPSVEERLAGVVREIVDEKLDGFLATYLPDRI